MITPEDAEKQATQAMLDYIDNVCTNALQNKYDGIDPVIVPLPGATKKACSDSIAVFVTFGWAIDLLFNEDNQVWVMTFIVAP